MASSAAAGVDGRLQRTVRSRLAICEACLDLVQEGVLQPNADQIAQRAGLSRRSVFNNCGDLAELYDAVFEVGMQRCRPLQRDVASDLPIGERVEAWTDARSKFLEATAPFARALTAQVLTESTMQQALRVSQEALRLEHREVERLFGVDLDGLPRPERLQTLEAIATASSPLTWQHLRHSRGLTLAHARAIVKRTVLALLRDTGVEIE
jgi:TetR/AcrR family transcriptional regulator of autoinduction and epiphytic fitness